MYRIFDFLISATLLILTLPIMILAWFVIRFESSRPVFIQERLGMNKIPFKLYKFRTMIIGTPSLSTHEISNSSLLKLGSFFRKTKLDELPQLFNVLKGDMSLVGPRPCLVSQSKVIANRDLQGVFCVKPGITGLSQIRKVDMSSPELLALTDSEMITKFSIKMYFSLLFSTALGKGQGDQIRNQK